MNLNNKKLAVSLSIIAVLVVVYQVFFNKPEPPPNRQAGIQQPLVTSSNPSPSNPAPSGNTGPTSPGLQPGLNNGSTGQPLSNNDSIVIDYNSPILLERITFEMAEPYPKTELPPEYGKPIFSGEGDNSETIISSTPQYEKEVEFKLNAIVIDSSRSIAIINDKILKKGDFIMDAEVISIEKNQVTLKLDNEEIVLSTINRIKKVKIIGGKGEN